MNSRKFILVASLVGAMSINAIAQPIYEEVKALFNPSIQYTLDGEEVLAGKGALVVDGTIYMPLRDAGAAFGLGVHYEDQTVILTTEDADAGEVEAEEVDADAEEVEAEEVDADAEDVETEETDVEEVDADAEKVKAEETAEDVK